MEFPFGHGHHSHTHHHHQKRDDDDQAPRPAYPPPGTAFSSFDDPPPPPPSSFHGVDSYPPPPSQATQVFHTSQAVPPPRVADEFSYSDYPAQPPHRPAADSFGYNYSSEAPPPPAVHGYPPADSAASVVHVSHEHYGSRNSYRPDAPAFVHHQSHQVNSEFAGKPTVKVVTKADPNYSLTIRDGKVVLARSDPSDEYQHWYKEEKYSTRVKDEEGFPSFALVNKATGLALKHSAGESHPVQLVPYNPDALDMSVLWALSKDFGDGFRTIRMVNNIRLNVDAFHGDKRSGGVRNGTTIVLWGWNHGDNQLWKILPYCEFCYP